MGQAICINLANSMHMGISEGESMTDPKGDELNWKSPTAYGWRFRFLGRQLCAYLSPGEAAGRICGLCAEAIPDAGPG